jgi:spectinomycin phosphotransferase
VGLESDDALDWLSSDLPTLMRVRSEPNDLDLDGVCAVLTNSWSLHVDTLVHLPVGGGSYHWKATDVDGVAHFVTVDDLHVKDWIGDTVDEVYEGLVTAFMTARALRDRAGLEFVVAPVPTVDGSLLTQLSDRYTVSVTPFLMGESNPFGPYPGQGLRDAVLELLVRLHDATAAVRNAAARRGLRIGGRRSLEAFLAHPDDVWSGGPFAEPAWSLCRPHARGLARALERFDDLADVVTRDGPEVVVTHGEPHPGNVMSVDGVVLLIDWDTAGLALPERDLWAIAKDCPDALDRYIALSGRHPDPLAMSLYELRWAIDDVASAIRMASQPHSENAETRRWLAALPANLAVLTA